jgi:hypothetical protein
MKVRFVVDDMSVGAAWMGFGRSQAAKMAAAGVSRRHFPLGDATVDIRVFDQDNAQVRITTAPTDRGFVFGLELVVPAAKGGNTIRTPVRRLRYKTYAYEDIDGSTWQTGAANRAWQTSARAVSAVRIGSEGKAGHLRNGAVKQAADGTTPGNTYVESGTKSAFLAEAYEVHPSGTRVWRGQTEYTVNYDTPGTTVFLRNAPLVSLPVVESTTTSKGTFKLPDIGAIVGTVESLGSTSTSINRSDVTIWSTFQYQADGSDAPIIVRTMTEATAESEVTNSYAGPYVLDTPPPLFNTVVAAEGQRSVTESTGAVSWSTLATLPWTSVPMLSSSGAYQTFSRTVVVRYRPEQNSNSTQTDAMPPRSLGVNVMFYDARAQICVWSYSEESRAEYTTSIPPSMFRSVCMKDVRGVRVQLWERPTSTTSFGYGAAVSSGGVADYVAIFSSPDAGGAPIFDGNPAFRAAVLQELADNASGVVKADMQAGNLAGYQLRPFYNTGDPILPTRTYGILVT